MPFTAHSTLTLDFCPVERSEGLHLHYSRFRGRGAMGDCATRPQPIEIRGEMRDRLPVA